MGARAACVRQRTTELFASRRFMRIRVMHFAGDHDADRLFRVHLTRRDLGMAVGELETHYAVTGSYREAHQIGEVIRRCRRAQRRQGRPQA